MVTAKRSAGVAPEVNLREHISHTTLPSANKAAHSGFEIQRRHHQKSKTGVSVAPQKGLMSSKIFFKKVDVYVPCTMWLDDWLLGPETKKTKNVALIRNLIS